MQNPPVQAGTNRYKQNAAFSYRSNATAALGGPKSSLRFCHGLYWVLHNLPVARVKLSEIEAAELNLEARHWKHDRRKPRGNLMARKILVVDDNVDAADTLEALLGMDGFDVTTVYDGIAAIAAASNVCPEVIVMDIGMPGMDGYGAARMIRQQPGGEDIVLIALTGWGQSADRNRTSQAGFNHHLVKPVDYDLLMKCVRP